MSYDPNMPQYGAPMPGGYNSMQVEKLRSNSTVVLILGILSFVIAGIFTAIPAWIWGGKILAEAKAYGVPEDVVSLAKWGRYLGIANVILTIVVVLLYIVFFIILIAAGGTQGY